MFACDWLYQSLVMPIYKIATEMAIEVLARLNRALKGHGPGMGTAFLADHHGLFKCTL